MRVEQYLRNSARRFASRIAVVAGRRSHTYAELDRQSDRFAAALAGQGVRPGDTVATFLDDSLPAVVAAFGILKAGAILAPFDAGAEASTLAAWLAAEGAVGIVTEARLATRAAEALVTAPSVRFVILSGGDRALAGGSCLAFEEIVGRIGVPAIVPHIDHDAAAVVFAREAVEADRYTHAEIAAAATLGQPSEHATIDAVPPLSGYDGFHCLVGTIAAGATQMLDGRPAGRAGTVRIATPPRRRMSLAG